MNKKIQLIILVLSISVLITSCGGSVPSEEELPDFGTINIGYIPLLAYAPFFIGAEKGYFEEQGLQVELQSFNSGSFMVPVLSTGDLDVGAGENGTALFNAIDQDLDIRVVSGMLSQPQGYAFVPFLVRKDLFDSGEITSPADLKGKKVAVNVERGNGEYTLVAVLERGGLTLDDVEIVTLPFPEMPPAFTNQAIDAAVLPYPLAGQAVGNGLAAILLDGDEIFDNPQTAVLYYGQRLLKPENHEVGVRFMMAYLNAVRDLQGDGWFNDENVAIISQYTNVPAPAIKSMAIYFGPNGEINESYIEKIMNYYIDQGYTEFSEPLSLSRILDLSFLEAALSRIGEFGE
jgi:NitT/TauT family transport system substrate-binding protein